jgi:hypothetical protein
MVSHAAYPTPVQLEGDRVRVFFVSRDAEGRGAVGWIDIAPDDPRRVLEIADRPAFVHGEAGSFDDRGIALGCVVRRAPELWLYYMGWSRAIDVPFRNSIGLTVSRDGSGKTFERPFAGPILDRSRHDPFSLSYPFVTTDGGGWRMIYGSHRGPGTSEASMRHLLMSATSPDGIDWHPSGTALLPLAAGELGHSRPWLWRDGSVEKLFFSIRREEYTVGLGMREGGSWQRVSDDLLGRSDDTWDNEATCYASHLRVDGKDLLFYCGNGYGRTGFGVAVLER